MGQMVRTGIQGRIKKRIERDKNKEQHQEIPINSALRKNIIYVDSQHTILSFAAFQKGVMKMNVSFVETNTGNCSIKFFYSCLKIIAQLYETSKKCAQA